MAGLKYRWVVSSKSHRRSLISNVSRDTCPHVRGIGSNISSLGTHVSSMLSPYILQPVVERAAFSVRSSGTSRNHSDVRLPRFLPGHSLNRKCRVSLVGKRRCCVRPQTSSLDVYGRTQHYWGFIDCRSSPTQHYWGFPDCRSSPRSDSRKPPIFLIRMHYNVKGLTMGFSLGAQYIRYRKS